MVQCCDHLTGFLVVELGEQVKVFVGRLTKPCTIMALPPCELVGKGQCGSRDARALLDRRAGARAIGCRTRMRAERADRGPGSIKPYTLLVWKIVMVDEVIELLARYLDAIGGSLEITAAFDGGTERVVLNWPAA